MKTRLSIGLDLDGVVASFSPAFRRISLEMFGLPDIDNPSYKANTDYDFADWGLTPDQVAAVFKRIELTKNFWESLGKMPGTELLNEYSRDYKVYFMTHRKEETYGRPVEVQSMRWISSNYDIPHPTVIVSGHKGSLAKTLELFAFIDDKPFMCEKVSAKSPTTKHMVFLRDNPYNQGEERFIRVPTLDAMLRRLP